MSVFIKSYSCMTGAGHTSTELWDHLSHGKLNRSDDGVCRVQGAYGNTSLERLTGRLISCWNGLAVPVPGKLGVIFASTKGCIEDIIWNASDETLSRDSLTPVLESFLKMSDLKPIESICVSNACASSHGAFFLGAKWIKAGIVDEVLVLAADEVGPFIHKGFQSLGALSPCGCRPFSIDRDGLQLGEAAAAVLLSKEESGFALTGIGIDTEGHSVTRPSPSGKSLERAARFALGNRKKVDAVIAHGTATKANDSSEDKVFSELCFTGVPITATKWCVGHTLGVSGSVDLCVAIEMLKHQTVFPIHTTKTIDPSFNNSYVIEKGKVLPLRSVLVTSLGFGGTNGALIVETVEK